jgi:hypothetical protein
LVNLGTLILIDLVRMHDGIRRTGLHAQAAAGTGRAFDAHEGEIDFLAEGLTSLPRA